VGVRYQAVRGGNRKVGRRDQDLQLAPVGPGGAGPHDHGAEQHLNDYEKVKAYVNERVVIRREKRLQERCPWRSITSTRSWKPQEGTSWAWPSSAEAEQVDYAKEGQEWKEEETHTRKDGSEYGSQNDKLEEILSFIKGKGKGKGKGGQDGKGNKGAGKQNKWDIQCWDSGKYGRSSCQ